MILVKRGYGKDGVIIKMTAASRDVAIVGMKAENCLHYACPAEAKWRLSIVVCLGRLVQKLHILEFRSNQRTMRETGIAVG